jgi:hypothetical protein
MAAKVGHEVAVAKIAQFTDRAEFIRGHLNRILESHAFRGSRRSQEFLRYIVEKSLSGDFDEIKERILGVEIFGRPLTYDTSADAIVRVTANDVRKRLLRYYELDGTTSEYRIHLPAGSYIPEFTRVPLEVVPELAAPLPANPRRSFRLAALVLCAVFVFAAGAGAGLLLSKGGRPMVPKQIAPWSALFQEARQTQLIFCDASIEMLQAYLHANVSLSDYANRRLFPDMSSKSADAKRAASMLGGADFTVTAAPVDLGIALRISGLAQSWSHPLIVRSARDLRFRDFKTDANFILLGSPRSNPWTALFQDQLDFSFLFDKARHSEVCRNKHPRAGEQSVYVPTAMGGATGEAFAIAAFLANPDQNGNVMILAGSNAEGTEAAARFVTELDLLGKTLRKYGIDPTRQPRHFEALLKVTTLAGSPNRFEVVALHALDGAGRQ